ncbi:CPXV016 protein [Cowpox virus]|uniref:CPXV016 protein n=1 Tax=Cowpox virus TaxID=10243 RepID=U5TJL5_COWPX|nr:CPXV016 protein [Cowpox virus]AGY98323.1 CPXV016 protein [Cowpox virus]AGY98540.1 CPXV016 protein [Cowpox virus]AGY99819.1 CPXV016 protein [Cowpox virus]SNB48144.1 CPXV016 protein [Cowpox virus]
MASLTEHAIVNVRKLIYSTYFEDFDNRISTNARINNDDPDDGYCSDGDIYSYNHTVRAKRIKVFKKKYYCIDNRQREQYTDSKTALINIIGSMTLMLKADRKNKSLVDQYKKFVKCIIKDNKSKTTNHVFNIPNNGDMDILYTYFNSPRTRRIKLDLIKYMVDVGIVNLNYVCKKTGYGILHAYLGNMDVDIDILEWLCNNGVNVNLQNRDLITPLHTYMIIGNVCVHVIKKIIELGGDMDMKCVNGMSPIMTYIANIDNINPKITNLYIESLDGNKVKNIPMMLHSYITLARNIDISVVYSFLQPGVKLHYKDSAGRTCLHQYILRHNISTSIIKLLHEYGNDINEPDNIGNTVLHTYLSMLSVVHILDPETDNDIRLDVIQCLLSLGADITAVNCLGYTPLTSYICTAQNYMYYDIIDCLISDKVLNMVKNRILQDLLIRVDDTPCIIHHIVAKYNIPTDLYTDEYEPYDSTNIHDVYHCAIIERYNNAVCETSGMTPLHVSIISHTNANIVMDSFVYLLSIQANINTPTKNGVDPLMLTMENNMLSGHQWYLVKNILDKRPNVNMIISFLDKCYTTGKFPSLLLCEHDIIKPTLRLALMLAGLDYCNKCIEYMERDIAILDNSHAMFLAFDKLVSIRDNIDKLTKLHINSRTNISIYDILVGKCYKEDIITYRENHNLVACCHGNDPLYDIINTYITDARSMYYIANDISKYIMDMYPVMRIPVTLLFSCIIGIFRLPYFKKIIINRHHATFINARLTDEASLR